MARPEEVRRDYMLKSADLLLPYPIQPVTCRPPHPTQPNHIYMPSSHEEDHQT